MTTFTELQCFNKLLLDKLAKMEAQIKIQKQMLISKREDYDDLLEFVEEQQFLDYAFCCGKCYKWKSMSVLADDKGDYMVCEDCQGAD